MAHRFTEDQVRDTVRALDAAGVEVIEVAHGDGIGGSSFTYGFSPHRRDDAHQGGRRGGAPGEDRGAAECPASAPPTTCAAHTTPARPWCASPPTARRPTSRRSTSPSPGTWAWRTAGFLMMSHRTTPAGAGPAGPDHGRRRAASAPTSPTRPARCWMHQARDRFEALVAEVGNEAWVGYHGHQNINLGIANSVIAAEVGVRLHRRVAVRAGCRARATRRPRSWGRSSTGWASPTGVDVVRHCSPRPRRSCGRTCSAGRRWTATRSCRAGPGCTRASCCTPSARPTATRSRPTRSSPAAASAG